MTGSGGLVGTAIRAAWTGDDITRLVRSPDQGAVLWDPLGGTIDKRALEGHDAVVHLAGANIACRWSKKTKALIRDSRVKGTRLLAETLAGLDEKPKVFLSASAVGYYGNRYGEPMREYATAGRGFLADLCRDWEDAAQPARDAGIRVVHPRLGVVLSKNGGALKKMLTPFKLGLGGRLGKGDQFMSWIHIDDLVAGLRHCIETVALEGPVNLAAPGAVTNREFTKTLGNVLVRPSFLPMPSLAARLAFGELADEALLAGQRADPERLRQTNYTFQYEDLVSALRALLKKSPPSPKLQSTS